MGIIHGKCVRVERRRTNKKKKKNNNNNSKTKQRKKRRERERAVRLMGHSVSELCKVCQTCKVFQGPPFGGKQGLAMMESLPGSC